MKAMILAAGRGTRMKQLCQELPKALVEIHGKTLIEHNLEQLQRAGFVDVVINVSCFAKKIIAKLGQGRRYGLNLIYSYEGSEPLGTGGGIYQALPLLGPSPFLVLSADIWTDFPWQRLTLAPSKKAHMVLVDNPSYHPQGDFHLQEDLCVSLAEPKLTYASFGVLDPRLFADQEPGCYSLGPILQKAIQQGDVSGEYYRGQWYNVGTPEQLALLKEALAQPNVGLGS